MNGSVRLVLRTSMDGEDPKVGPSERTVAHSNSNASVPLRRFTLRFRYWESNGQIPFVWHIAWYEQIDSNILSFIFNAK